MYEISSKAIPSRAAELIGRDSRQNYIYKRLPNQLVRFGDYHPRNNQEAFFYNVLLSKIPFNDEADLLSPGNNTGTYMVECMLRDDHDPLRVRPDGTRKKILDDDDDLEDMVSDYCQRHMFRYDMLFTLS